MRAEIDSTVRKNLARGPDFPTAPEDLDPDVDMTDGHRLTALNKVLFLTSAGDGAGMDLSAFTEPDVARMRTRRDVAAALSRHAATEA